MLTTSDTQLNLPDTFANFRLGELKKRQVWYGMKGGGQVVIYLGMLNTAFPQLPI